MFSVIIPLYNKAKYIEKALESLQNQIYKNFEVIIVDDGSTDGSAEIAQKFVPKGFSVKILQQKNSGVSSARNNGVAAANGDYICFLDADDWWCDNFLAEINKLTVEFADAGIYGTNYYKVKNGKNIEAKLGIETGFERGYFDYVEAYSRSMWMPLWTGAVCVPKQIFTEFGGFKPELKMGEDFHLWIRIALKYRTVLLNKPLAFYNQDVEQATRAAGRKLHKTENHFLFNMPDIYSQTADNKKLKQLLDNISVYGLFPYYLNKNTRVQTLSLLKQVDWTKQPAKTFKQYFKTPVFLLKIKDVCMLNLSHIKRKILKTI